VKLNITFEMQQAIVEPTTRYAALAQLAEKARAAGFKHTDVCETVSALLNVTPAEVEGWLYDIDSSQEE